MGRKRKCLGNAEVYCVVSMNICCVKLTENLGLKSSVIIKSPGGYLEALSPGLLLEVTCLNLENPFWRPKGLAIKISKKPRS